MDRCKNKGFQCQEICSNDEYSFPFENKRSLNSNLDKMILWDTSPSSSWSAGFPNKVTIYCPNNSSLNLLDRSVARWRRQWQPTPVFLPGESQGRRSLVGCRLWGRTELDKTEWLHFHFSLSCIGEGNGNPLQCSCLENPRDGGACWAAVYGVAQSRTRLQRLSSSSVVSSVTVDSVT